jgi:ATP-dependent protease HslVU (ClpYQ) peptidase subunit
MRIYMKNKRVIAGDGKHTFGLHGMQKVGVLAQQAVLVGLAVTVEMQAGTDKYIEEYETEDQDKQAVFS